MKRLFNIILICLVCFVLAGCVNADLDVNINNDGSGSFSGQIRFSEMGYAMLKSFVNSNAENQFPVNINDFKSFVYNGKTYYGITKEGTFSSVEEFNSIVKFGTGNDEVYKLEKLSDNTFRLTVRITPENLSAIQDNGIDIEMMKLFMNDAMMIGIINMPGNVQQIDGDSEGITIEGNSIKVDFLKINIPTESNVAKKYVFKTKASTQRFSDVPVSLWSYEAIEALARGGLVSGVGDGRFSPERGMKISEFCQVLANAMGLESGADETGYWAAKAIKSCIDKGYIYSHGDINSKNYDEVITREEAIAAMQLASGREKIQGKNIMINDIPDGNQISTRYKNLIVQAYNSGITTGVNDQLKFSPKNKLTRGQVCQLFYNVNWTTKN